MEGQKEEEKEEEEEEEEEEEVAGKAAVATTDISSAGPPTTATLRKLPDIWTNSINFANRTFGIPFKYLEPILLTNMLRDQRMKVLDCFLFSNYLIDI